MSASFHAQLARSRAPSHRFAISRPFSSFFGNSCSSLFRVDVAVAPLPINLGFQFLLSAHVSRYGHFPVRSRFSLLHSLRSAFLEPLPTSLCEFHFRSRFRVGEPRYARVRTRVCSGFRIASSRLVFVSARLLAPSLSHRCSVFYSFRFSVLLSLWSAHFPYVLGVRLLLLSLVGACFRSPPFSIICDILML